MMVVVAATILSLSYISMRSRCEVLGREIELLEKEIEAKSKVYRTEHNKWLRMKSPQNIERALRDFNLNMDWPRQDQIIYIEQHDWRDNQTPADDTRPAGAHLQVAAAGGVTGVRR